MAPDTDLARWVGYGGAALADGTPLVPHETICAVPRAEAEASDHWQPVDAKRKTLKTRTPRKPSQPSKPKRTAPAPSESAGTGEAAGAPSEDGGS
jgi:hypothetical protein